MNSSSHNTDHFAAELARMKHGSSREISDYWQAALPKIEAAYGEASVRSMQAFASIMDRGGKRIRAALAETGYRMFGGTSEAVVNKLGLTLEMIHAYVLVIDDICDRSDLRRGGPTAHKLLESWHHEASLHGDAAHFGASMATLSALTGMHEAMRIIGDLPVSAERRIAALDNLNRILVITGHGQFNDIMNEASKTLDKTRVENVLIWKTAYYTFANPLQFGAILAGASQPMLDKLMDYSMAAGRAFQISDDILGLYGSVENTGKDPADDIKEGKRTILTVTALEQADPQDAAFLEAQLGNGSLTAEDFERCKQIIKQSGALTHAQTELDRSCDEAAALAKESAFPGHDGTEFLAALATYLKTRKA